MFGSKRDKIRDGMLLPNNKRYVANPKEKAFEEKEIERLEQLLQHHRPELASHYIPSFAQRIVPDIKREHWDLLFFKKDKRDGFCKNCKWSREEHYEGKSGFNYLGPMCPYTGKTLFMHLKQGEQEISQDLQNLQQLSVPTQMQDDVTDLLPKKEPSKFFEVLAKHDDKADPVVLLLALLSPLITCAFELQLFFTIACAASRQKDSGVTELQRNRFLREGLLSAHTNKIVKSEDDFLFCQRALKKAQTLGAFTGATDDPELFERLQFRYTVAAMENTTFVQELKALIQANSDSIAKLQNRMDAHESAIQAVNKSLNDFKKAYRKQQRCESIGSFVKLVVGAVSFGAASAVVDIFTKLQKVVDLSDFKSISQLLQGCGVDSFKAVAYLKEDGAEDAICGGLNQLAGQDLDKAMSNHVCLKMLAVASASVDEESVTESCGSVQGPNRQESTATTVRAPQDQVKEDLRTLLKEHDLEELEEPLAKYGFKTVKILQKMALKGQEEFAAKLEKAQLKVGQIESLWDAFDTPPAPTAVTQAPNSSTAAQSHVGRLSAPSPGARPSTVTAQLTPFESDDDDDDDSDESEISDSEEDGLVEDGFEVHNGFCCDGCGE
eukprot:1796564-Rhodomonas_salina.1